MKNWNHTSYTRDETRVRILDAARFMPKTETVALADALLRVNAEDIYSLNTLPNCPSSFRDGICVRSQDFTDGMPDTTCWQEGAQYAYCNTGFGIPEGYDTVVMIEDVELSDKGGIVLSAVPEKGQYVNLPGCRLRKGDLLVAAHTLLVPQLLGLLASGGHAQVKVITKPKVEIIPTGNELVPAGTSQIPRGRNIESNSAMMVAQLKLMGADPYVHDIICDDPNKIEVAVRDALEWADVIVTNGGTSKGTGDWAAEVYERVGEILVREVDYGPGKHTMMAISDGIPIVGAVGPSIGAEYAIEWYVRPLVDAYYGLKPMPSITVRVRLPNDIEIPVSKSSGNPISVCRWFELGEKDADGVYEAFAIAKGEGSARGLLAPVCVLVPKETGGYHAGDVVEAELRSSVVGR